MTSLGPGFRLVALPMTATACQMLLLRILYWRFRLWLLRKEADVRNAIGGYLLRISTRLAGRGCPSTKPWRMTTSFAHATASFP